MGPVKKYNRREFIKYGAISGAALTVSPLNYLLPGELTFHLVDPGVYIPPPEAGPAQIFVYCGKYNEATLKLSDVFSTEKKFQGNVVIAFYKGQLPKVKNDLTVIDHNLNNARNIIWLDDYKEDTINNAFDSSGIIANDTNHVTQMPTGIGDDLDYRFDLETMPSKPVLEFKPLLNTILINYEASPFMLTVNGSSASVNQMEIPVIHLKQTTFGFNSLVKNSCGGIRFKTSAFLDKSKPIQPYSSYIIEESDGKSALHHISYFENKSFGDNAALVITYFPFRVFTNETEPVTSLECSLTTNQPVRSNFLNEYGKRFLIRDFSKFICRLVIIKVPNDVQPKYIFIAGGGVTVNNNGGSADGNLLLGYSGTERLKLKGSSIHLAFVYTHLLRLRKDNYELDTSGDSITSQLLFDQMSYCLDTDKSPNFNNSDPGFTLASGGRNAYYKAIEIGQMPARPRPVVGNGHHSPLLGAERKLVPLIPTLAFCHALDLEDNGFLKESLLLEKTFTKMRLVNFDGVQAAPDALINPRGFIQLGNNYEYIPTIKNPKKKNATLYKKVISDRENYRFSIQNGDNDLDFRLSMSREDVFFVMTPQLLHDSLSTVNFDIFFGIHGFDVNLIYAENGAPKNDAQIIIFKHSRFAMNDLVKETTKWSNQGKYQRGGLQGAISKKFQELDDAAARNKDGDYDYINNTVRNDPNWNGVLVLNIPIGGPSELPSVFSGLTASQTLQQPAAGSNLVPLRTKLGFTYIALPVNKTFVDPLTKLIAIKNTAFYGLIDYDNLREPNPADYAVIKKHLNEGDQVKFLLSKLLVRFENNEIKHFKSVAFVRVPHLFEESIRYDGTALSTADNPPATAEVIKNLVRLDGHYQKNSSGADQFSFDLKSDIHLEFNNDCFLASLDLHKASFNYDGDHSDSYRFDFDGEARFKPDTATLTKLIHFDSIVFQNIGLSFQAKQLALPDIGFDVSKLFVIPKISFDCKSFFGSFPLRFNRFQWFKINGGHPANYDFHDIGHFDLPADGSLWSLIFDFDLGTLGNLDLFKALKAELLFGWSKGKGLKFGLKLNGPSQASVHINLFGALGLDIQTVDFCQVGDHFMLRLADIHLSILGTRLPSKDDNFSAMIFAGPGNKTAWFLAYIEGHDPDPKKNKLLLSVGQRVGLDDISTVYSVQSAIDYIKLNVFNPAYAVCNSKVPDNVYRPQANWLVASDSLLDGLSGFINFKFIFNDPSLYGVYLELVKLFSIDILYKKVSDDLGIWALEFALDPSLRVIDAGEMVITLPDLGIMISTNGDWRLDVGFPVANNWSRSCMIQLRPFIGWAGIYISRLRSASLSLFGPYTKLLKNQGNGATILQAGLAVRIGIGAYIDKGIFYVGASISVYGIVEGAFAFDSGRGNLGQLLPDAFALMGRIGAIAELIGYVDFKVIKAAIHILLRVEFGMTLVYIESAGLQPVPLYIEGQVEVSLDFTIACFKVFGHHFCITIHLSFSAYVRFNYTLGGNSGGGSALNYAPAPKEIPVNDLGDIPVVFIPAFTPNTVEGQKVNYLIYNYAIPFFGIKADKGALTSVGQSNVVQDGILRPLFSAIFDAYGQRTLHYSDLKNILLKRKRFDADPELKFSFPNYRPVFLSGYDTTAQSVINDAMLKAYFHISDGDLTDYYKSAAAQDCGGANSSCLYRPVSIPISSRIKVVEAGGAHWETVDKGFTVSMSGIFSDNAAHDHRTETKRNYTSDHIYTLESKFENSKTQYAPVAKAKPADPDQDLREDFAIQEYFRLMGLIMLESYYNYKAGLDKNKNTPDYDPELTLPMLFADDKWAFDAPRVEALLGQVNYFYNNGLRFADVQHDPNQYQSYFSMIGQTEIVADLLDETKVFLKDVHISLKSNSTNDVTEITKDLFADENLLRTDFLERARTQLSATAASMGDQFKNGHNSKTEQLITTPYQLVNLRLAVNNSKTESKDGQGTFRFFEIPGSIHAKFPNSQRCVLRTLLSPNGNGVKKEDLILISSIACCNLSFKIKCHKPGVDTVSLELSNVTIDDLDLFNKLVMYPPAGGIKTVSLYDMRNPQKPAKVDTKNLSIVKTNISKKTHPPIIINENQLAADTVAGPEAYFAVIDKDVPNFIRLMWEGLTTNDGGYFLISSTVGPLNAFDSEKTEYLLMLSLELTDGVNAAAAEGYCNYFKIYNQPNKVFSGVDGNAHLVCEVLLDKKDGTGQYSTYVKEYYPTIPAHCFGVELERTAVKIGSGREAKTDTNSFLQFIPVAINLMDTGGVSMLCGDDAFPIMPKDKPDDDKKYAGRSYYNHITPLRNYDPNDPHNLKRYDAIHSVTKVSFTLRDIYGFDFCPLPITFDYQHVYFDKIVAIHAWPGITFSFWLNTAVDMKWTLTLTINEKAIETLLKNINGVADTVNQLNTIKAQLLDTNCQIGVKNINPDKTAVKVTMVKDKVLSVLNAVIQKLGADPKGPVQESYPFTFEIKTPDFKTMLNPQVYISREVDETYFVAKPATSDPNEIWDFDMISCVHTPIPLVKPSSWKKGDHIDNPGRALNKALANTNLIVGEGMHENAHVLFLIDKSKVTSAFVTVKFDPSVYMAIRPYVNQYWAGEYVPTGSKPLKFSRVDLDHSLRLVLGKIDEWLSGNNLSQLSLDKCINILVDGKKCLVKGDVASGVISDRTAELSNKLDFFQAHGDNIKSEEFEDQLLKKLLNYYQTDGILHTSVPAQTDLAGHRFTLSIQPGVDPADNTINYAKMYEIDSSKILFDAKNSAKWDVLFNYTGDHTTYAKDTYKFNAVPAITHIEYEIGTLGIYNNGIERSKWIQLYEPLTLPKIDVDGFPVITRSVPPDPLILTNMGSGESPDDGSRQWTTDLGKWRYHFGLRDSVPAPSKDKPNDKPNEDIYYVPGDRFYINLAFKKADGNSLNEDAARNFPGFLAYWSSLINTGALDPATANANAKMIDFAAALRKELSVPPPKTDPLPPISNYAEGTSLLLILEKKDTSRWNVFAFTFDKSFNTRFYVANGDHPDIHLKVNDEVTDINKIVFGGMNVFAEPHFVSVKPQVWVTRNENVKNANFKFTSGIISPTSWTTIHLKYLKGIHTNGALNAIFADICKRDTTTQKLFTTLPLKATVKYPIKTADLGKHRNLTLPTLSIRQLEFKEGIEFAVDVDKIFTNIYENGYPAITLDVSNIDEGQDNDLPIFSANTIFKST